VQEAIDRKLAIRLWEFANLFPRLGVTPIREDFLLIGESLIILLFLLGFGAIIFEHWTRIDKSAAAMLTGVGCWVIYLLMVGDGPAKISQLSHHLSDISQILFFLIGAMLVVEVIDVHHGFDLLRGLFRTSSPQRLAVLILLLTFFMSSVLDNLTTVIVMICLLRRAIPVAAHRMLICAALIPAANAGGAWTPIGDITTTMLWIGGCVTVPKLMVGLALPSLVSLAVLIGGVCLCVPKELEFQPPAEESRPVGGRRVLVAGLAVLILIPVLKALFNLPPFMGMLLGVALLWAITDLMHHGVEERASLRVFNLLGKIDLSSVLFFLGVLLAVDALESAGLLHTLSIWMRGHFSSEIWVANAVGVVSSLVDNVPLVAACIKLHPIDLYPCDHCFWNLLAYSAGTGGSLLIIGSAPGIAVMSMERIGFGWYLRRMSGIALLSYTAGMAVLLLV
jgi:Na+/H+ antiporter NhaD/arsenite permease-like protein